MTINTAMLVGLGFLLATLLSVLIAPAYRRRTVRLTTDAIKRTLPLTELEIRADKDRLRAEHAVRVHNLETKLEAVTYGSSRQKIEVNRRDARISELESLVTEQKTQLEALDNARRVLEQTVTDRLPRIEGRLTDARKLLSQRDGEIATLAETAQKQARAIAEAMQINVQQSTEIERMTAALSTRAARNQDGLGDARFDGEVALQSEIEALRGKSREQAALIANLQELMARPQIPQAASATITDLSLARSARDSASEAEIARLKSELAQAQAAAKAVQGASTSNSSASNPGADAEVQRLTRVNQELSLDATRLKAEVQALEAQVTERKSKESPVAAKAKITALETQVAEQTLTIQSLRAETAAVNERLARQAAHYMDEMKRLGAGSLPASTEARRAKPEPAKRSLFDRISDPRVVHLTPLSEKRAAASTDEVAAPVNRGGSLFSMADQVAVDEPVGVAANGTSDATTVPPAEEPTTPVRRPRLLERITSIDKPS